jgi:carbonic anhydrase
LKRHAAILVDRKGPGRTGVARLCNARRSATSGEELERYAASFENRGLRPEPRKGLAVITCMDARLDPAGFLGLTAGNAHVIRNAGAIVTDDVLRSLVVSHWRLGTEEVVLIGHADCGMSSFTNDDLRRQLRKGGVEANEIDALPFYDVETNVRDGVTRIREFPALGERVVASGYVYDVATGRLRRVVH